MMLPFLMILNLGMQLLEALDERVLLQGLSLLLAGCPEQQCCSGRPFQGLAKSLILDERIATNAK